MAARWLASVLVGLAFAGSAGAQADPTFRVGRLVIEGNTATPDSVILDMVGLRPGQTATVGQVRKAEARLRESDLFRANRWRGTGPTVRVLPDEIGSEFLDVLISVEERPWNFLAFGTWELMVAAVNGDLDRMDDAAGLIRRGFAGPR